MTNSKAATVEEYLQGLAPEQRGILETVRNVILDNLPKGYEENMNWGMISYEIPLSRYPTTYNKKPLSYAALAAQKDSYSLYLMCAYTDAEQREKLEKAFEQIEKKPNMGKSCIRFKAVEDIPLAAIGELIASTSAEEYIEIYEKARKK